MSDPALDMFVEKLRGEKGLFAASETVYVARAPGRLDVMGGIADYSGSHVLEMPIAEAAFAAVQPTDERKIRIVTQSRGQQGNAVFSAPLNDLFRDGKPLGYHEARRYFAGGKSRKWAGYIAGAFVVLANELGVNFERGAAIFLNSNVPSGKGVSSSAAIEVATMKAVAAAFDIDLSGLDLAVFCQKVENLVVGAPCGIMDQMTSSLGSADRLLSIRCQPTELLGNVGIPEDIAFWGIDSGIRHSVGGGDYGMVRTGAFMGYRIIAKHAGFDVRTVADGVVEIDDPEWHGYLANIETGDFERRFATKLPRTIKGDEFLHEFGGITDRVTRVEPHKTYAIYHPTKHPVYENSRVVRFGAMLSEPTPDLELSGRLMYESHDSYSACGLGSEGTDLLVDMVRSSPNLFGAKITGGGIGGTVAILGRKGADPEVKRIADEYEGQTGRRAQMFSGSSAGAEDFGVVEIIV